MHATRMTAFDCPDARDPGRIRQALRRLAAGAPGRVVLDLRRSGPDRALHRVTDRRWDRRAERGGSWELLEEMLGSGIERFDLQ